jgi:hypothetical protein
MKHALAGIALILAVCASGLAAAWWLRFTNAGPTTAEYLAHLGPAARLVPAGELTFDGAAFACGRRPTVLAPGFSDYAAAFPGFLILNPERFETLPLILKRYAYAHECGHQVVGRGEEDADCHAIRAGLAEGWLDDAGLEAICDFISRAKGDVRHPAGMQRCASMRRCYARARPARNVAATP